MQDAKRVFKRIVIALIYLFIIGGIGFFIYLSRQPPAPTCFDRIQNQGETGVDCGGPCRSCEQIKDLTVFEAQFFVTRQGFVDLFAEVKNPNITYGVHKLKYVFELYDRDGVFVGSQSGVTYIAPDSTRFITEHAISVPKEPARVEFTLSPPQFEEVKNYVKPRLSVIGLSTRSLGEDEAGFLAAEGTVINQMNFDFDTVDVAIRLKNQANQTVAVNSHEVRTLVANDARFFKARWFYRVPEFTTPEVQVSTNIFEESNYLKFLNERQ